MELHVSHLASAQAKPKENAWKATDAAGKDRKQQEIIETLFLDNESSHLVRQNCIVILSRPDSVIPKQTRHQSINRSFFYNSKGHYKEY